jgi:hypothetical protein
MAIMKLQPPTPPAPPANRNEARDSLSLSTFRFGSADRELIVEVAGPVNVHPERDTYLTLGTGAWMEIMARHRGVGKRLALTPERAKLHRRRRRERSSVGRRGAGSGRFKSWRYAHRRHRPREAGE